MTNRLDEVQLYLTVFHCLRQRSEHPLPPHHHVFLSNRGFLVVLLWDMMLIPLVSLKVICIY